MLVRAHQETTGQILKLRKQNKETTTSSVSLVFSDEKPLYANMIHAPLPNDMIDNNGVRMLQQACQLHGNLREPHAWTAKDLDRI